MGSNTSLRLDDELKERLEKLADANEWQIGQIRQAVREANAGDFASAADVRAVAKKWKANPRC